MSLLVSACATGAPRRLSSFSCCAVRHISPPPRSVKPLTRQRVDLLLSSEPLRAPTAPPAPMASKPASGTAAPPAPRTSASGADAASGNVDAERLAFVAKALLGLTVAVTVRSAAGLGLLLPASPARRRHAASAPRRQYAGGGCCASRAARHKMRPGRAAATRCRLRHVSACTLVPLVHACRAARFATVASGQRRTTVSRRPLRPPVVLPACFVR